MPRSLPERRTDQDRRPHAYCRKVEEHVGEDRTGEDQAHYGDLTPVDDDTRRCFRDDRLVALLLTSRDRPEHCEGHERAERGLQDIDGSHAVDPHHGRRCISDDRPRPTRVRRGDDGGQEPDVETVPEDDLGDRPPDHRRSDVVEEGRDDHDQKEQHEPALPVIRQPARKEVRNARLLEVLGQDGESQQQPEKVDQDGGLVSEVMCEAAEAHLTTEVSENDLVGCDRRHPDDREVERELVEHHHAQEDGPEHDELERNSEHLSLLPGAPPRVLGGRPPVVIEAAVLVVLAVGLTAHAAAPVGVVLGVLHLVDQQRRHQTHSESHHQHGLPAADEESHEHPDPDAHPPGPAPQVRLGQIPTMRQHGLAPSGALAPKALPSVSRR